MDDRDANLLNAYRGLLDLARSGRVIAVLMQSETLFRLGDFADIDPAESRILWEIDYGGGYAVLCRRYHESEGRAFLDLTNL